MKTIPLLTASIVLLASGSFANQSQHHHEDLGSVHFPVSCAPAIQEKFNRAVAQLHSFWYDEAEKAFSEITENCY